VRKLAEGNPVFAGERIRTGTGTVLEIEFTDKSRFTLGPNAEFEVEKYFQAAGGSSGEEAFTSRVFKGAFRFVSGLIAKKKAGKRADHRSRRQSHRNSRPRISKAR